MDLKALDKALQAIAEKRNELSKIDYNNPKYDDMEEELHDLEDAFQEEFGEYLAYALKRAGVPIGDPARGFQAQVPRFTLDIRSR